MCKVVLAPATLTLFAKLEFSENLLLAPSTPKTWR